MTAHEIRGYYRREILRVLAGDGPTDVGSLGYAVQPHSSGVGYAVVGRVREARRELEAEGVVRVHRDTTRRNHPLVAELVPRGPRMVHRIKIVVDVVGLAPGSVSTVLSAPPTDVRHLASMMSQALRQLGREHAADLWPVLPPE